MEELWKVVGGLPGIIGVLVGGAAVFWRTKFPQIGLDYLQRELELHRREIAAADNERRQLREELKKVRDDLIDLERRYMEALQEKEVIAHDLRQSRRMLRQAERLENEG